MVEIKRQWPHLSGTLFLSSLVSVGLLALGLIINRGYGFSHYSYAFMVWNLFLAWLPLVFVLWLQKMLKHKRWSSWQGITLSLLWLVFLPNSFYIITDFIHLADVVSVDIVFDAVMLTSFVVTSLMLGFTSLFLFHMELRKRLPAVTTNRMVAIILLLCSFAIYLGRDLRWNTWDIFLNPAGILFDVSDRLIAPASHPHMLLTTVSFFVLLSMFYLVTWHVVRAVKLTTVQKIEEK
jgi:uncharacterized membrane protein